MLQVISRRAVSLAILLVATSCAGGGGCGGCGSQPIAGGFPADQVIPNGASIRITRPGLDALAQSLGGVAAAAIGADQGGALAVSIPKVPDITGTVALVCDYTIKVCPAGADPKASPPTCGIDVGLAQAKLHIDAVTPNALKVSGTLPIRLRDLPISVDSCLCSPNIAIGLGSGSCSGNTPNVDYEPFAISATIPLVADTDAPRKGFTRLDIDHAVISAPISSDDLTLCGSGICGDILKIAKGAIAGVINTQLNGDGGANKGILHDFLASALCTKPDPNASPPCPTGTLLTNDGTTCVYRDQPTKCVASILGTSGTIDLGAALSSLSPGTSGGLAFEIAAAGSADPSPGLPADNKPYAGHTPNGLTLSALAGALPAPQSSCVPMVPNPPPAGIPIPDEMRADKIAGWPAGDPGPHVGIALAGRFLDYAFGGIYNSGLLCLGLSTEQIQTLKSGLVSALVPSIRDLTFEQASEPIAITTRPRRPPALKLGGGTDLKTDPLLTITLSDLDVDFYVWSMDRYVRVFTFTGDVTAPINLSTARDAKTNPTGGLLPTIGQVSIANGVVTNSDLLTEDPQLVAAALTSVIGGFSSQLIGAVPAIDLSSLLGAYGLGLSIPEGGVRKLTKGDDDFLAIFGDLTAGAPPTIRADTRAEILSKTVHPEAMGIATASRDELPVLHARFGSPLDDGYHAVEYAWGIDDASRSEWSSARDVDVQTDYLFFQGKHTLKVWARLKGEVASQDETPAEVPFTIDVLPPMVEVTESPADATRVAVRAQDFVSGADALVARYRVVPAAGAPGAFGAWRPLRELREIEVDRAAASVDVEVRDEEGNVKTVSQALVRGRPDPSLATAGCGCTTAGSPAPPSGALGTAMLAGLALLWRSARRPRRARSSRSRRSRARREGGGRDGDRPAGPGGRRRASLGAGAIALLAAIAAASAGCSCGGEGSVDNHPLGCGTDCHQPCGPALTPGVIGAYTSLATAKDGTIWVAGYDDSVHTQDGAYLYGDLVVGQYDAAKELVAWETVDGVPERTDGTCPSNERTGWRGGETDAGDDVGLWTSVQTDPDGRPMVAYYDATHRALKFAAKDGAGWAIHVVSAPAGADAGRYAKMTIVAGSPVIAFSVVERGTSGHVRSRLALAKAQTASPRATGDWTFEDALVDDAGPCRAFSCEAGDVCVADTGACATPGGGCTPADCGAGSACVVVAGKPACSAIITPTYLEPYPNAVSDYIDVANGPAGLGLVAYDRVHGNLLGVTNTNGGWTTQILDGETGSRADGKAVDTGDTGVGASLAIAPNGDWHVSYVDALADRLVYVLVPGGHAPARPEVVDDGVGLGAGAAPFADGKHIVGDDSRIRVGADGAVLITYQDATVGDLRVAIGAPKPDGTHAWTVESVAQPARFAGFFPHFVGDARRVANFWRATDHATGDTHGDVAFIDF